MWARLALGLLSLSLALAAMAISAAACGSGGGAEPTTLTTKLSGESKESEELTVLEGAKIKDKATLTGTNASKASGKVKYEAYTDSKCEKLYKEAGEVTVSGESVPASNELELEAGKTYYWQASYSGDSKNDASTSTCGKEVANVKAKTELSTTLSGESKEATEIEVVEGTGVTDQATLEGTNASGAGGKVTYKIYSDNKCEKLVKEAGEVTVTSGNVPASNEETPEIGTYYWRASYNGDSLHQESKSGCNETLKVRAATSLTTSLTGEGNSSKEIAVSEGASVDDAATLSGTDASIATGTVKYYVYGDPGCVELLAEAGTASVAGEVVPASSNQAFSSPGTYYWQAAYSGDSLNHSSTSACRTEVATVTSPVTTSLSGEGQSGEQLEVAETAAVTDTATLYGKHASKATGTVKYKVYSDTTCKTLVAEAGTVSVAGETAPASKEEKLSAGTYYWRSEYSGDANNPAANSVCGTEAELVAPATSLTTSLAGAGKSGAKIEVPETASVTDTATLSGKNASTATGYVKYNVYSNSECKTLAAEAGDVGVTRGVVGESNEVTLPAGTYYWQATYSGDGSNHGSQSTCGAEVATVTAPVTTSLSGAEQSGAEIEVPETAAVTDTATLHGEHAGTATGSLKYYVYSDSECKHLAAEAGTVSIAGETAPTSNKETLSAGSYYWRAEYSGDSHNPAATSTCGREVAVVKPPNSQYAAIGDSYSSGEGTGEVLTRGTSRYYAKTNISLGKNKNECHRSPVAYPARLAGGLFPGRLPSVTEEKVVFERQPPFIFRACSGAVTENIGGFDFKKGQYNEWIEGAPGAWLPTPEQSLWLGLPGGEPTTGPNNAITLVTLTIGGNDAGFATILKNCIGPEMRLFGRVIRAYSPVTCKEIIEEWETGMAKTPNTLKPPEEEGIPSLKEKLRIVLRTIHELAPNARIRIPLYPQIVNPARNGNIPVVPGGALYIENALPRVNSVATAMERFGDRLNQTIAATVQKWATEQRVNAKVIPETVTAFTGHRLGDQPNPLWVNGVTVPTNESFHPNCLGQISIANSVVRNLGVFVAGKWGC